MDIAYNTEVQGVCVFHVFLRGLVHQRIVFCIDLVVLTEEIWHRQTQNSHYSQTDP